MIQPHSAFLTVKTLGIKDFNVNVNPSFSPVIFAALPPRAPNEHIIIIDHACTVISRCGNNYYFLKHCNAGNHMHGMMRNNISPYRLIKKNFCSMLWAQVCVYREAKRSSPWMRVTPMLLGERGQGKHVDLSRMLAVLPSLHWCIALLSSLFPHLFLLPCILPGGFAILWMICVLMPGLTSHR